MNNLKIAKTLLKIAKSLEADYEYRSDPDHKHKPKGGVGSRQNRAGREVKNPNIEENLRRLPVLKV